MPAVGAVTLAVEVTLGMSSPLSVEVTSSAADALGVAVLIPTCAVMVADTITKKMKVEKNFVMMLFI
jgi:hypothetical protein